MASRTDTERLDFFIAQTQKIYMNDHFDGRGIKIHLVINEDDQVLGRGYTARDAIDNAMDNAMDNED